MRSQTISSVGLVCASALSMFGSLPVHAQVIVGTQDFTITVEQAAGPCEDPSFPVGTDCGDGRVYAGVIDGLDVFLASSPEADWQQFRTTGLYTIGAVNPDGFYNMYAVQQDNLSDHPAFNVCASKTDGGQDWYLPSVDELTQLRTSLGGAFGTYVNLASLNVNQLWTSNKSFPSGSGAPDGGRAIAFLPWDGTTEPVDVEMLRTVQCITYGTPRVYSDPCPTTANAGELCEDGSIYAGVLADSRRLFVAQAPEPLDPFGRQHQWATSTTRVNTTSFDDGLFNKTAAGSSNVTTPAIDLCAAKGSKWYLPAINELSFLNGEDHTNLIFESANYWSSTEAVSNARIFHMGLNTGNTASKTNRNRVQCTYSDVSAGF